MKFSLQGADNRDSVEAMMHIVQCLAWDRSMDKLGTYTFYKFSAERLGDRQGRVSSSVSL